MAENISVVAVPPQTSQPKGGPSVSATETAEVDKAQQSAASESQAASEQTDMSVEELRAAIEQMNELMKQGQRSLSFSVDESADEVVVRVVDTETQELVRQIPNEETLKFKQHLEGMLGLLFSDKA